jgi:hypothetical protein
MKIVVTRIVLLLSRCSSPDFVARPLRVAIRAPAGSSQAIIDRRSGMNAYDPSESATVVGSANDFPRGGQGREVSTVVSTFVHDAARERAHPRPRSDVLSRVTSP